MSQSVMQKAFEIQDYLIRVRRHMHENPELGMEEVETTRFIEQELALMGVEMAPLGVKSGVLGIIRGEKSGPDRVTALRADIDALPMQEKTGHPWASRRSGIMHACGHDGHAACLLGVAKLLSGMRSQFSGMVKLIFQPGEETLFGARSMVDAGVLENPKVEAIMAVHAWPQLDVGQIGYWSGPYMASADKFTVRIFGAGGHGAYPHRSKDPLLAMTYAVQVLNTIVSREIDAVDKVVLSVCMVNGGTAFNIIPEEVTFCGTVRCHNEDIRQSMPKKMDRLIKGVAESFGCNYEMNYVFGVPVVVNDPELTAEVVEAGKQALGEAAVIPLDRPVMGSEDFSHYLEKVPKGVFIRLGINPPGQVEQMRNHNDRFDFSDGAAPYGVALMTQFVLNRNQ